jgi:predicted aconitase with swiveling domain
MMPMEIKARSISRGKASGDALISEEPIGFLGGVDPGTGDVIEKGHPLEGRNVSGKVLVFPNGKGSTVGSYVMLQLAKNGKAPAAIINVSAEPIIAVGAIISGIPMVDRPEADVLNILKENQEVEVDGDRGLIVLRA